MDMLCKKKNASLLSCPLVSLSQVLGQQVADEHVPDISLIGEMGDVTELGRLVQLVLGCAVSCEKKQGKLGYLAAVLFP